MAELDREMKRLRERAGDASCHERVPDHTDHVDCGDRVLRRGLCAVHLGANISWLRAQRSKLQKLIERIDETLALLQSESG